MEPFIASAVTSNLIPLQPKSEVNLFSEDDYNLGSFHQLETQLLDSMELSDQQPSHFVKREVLGDDNMHELGGSMNMLLPGSTNSACQDGSILKNELKQNLSLDMPPKRIEGQPVNDIPIVGRSSMATNASDAPTQKWSSETRLKHGDRLRKCLKENDKIPIVFRKKDGHPVGKYASLFKTELGLALKKFAPLQVSGWKNVTEEQKRPIFDRLESAFTVEFGLGPSLVKKEIENLMSRRFRDYRQKMHEHYKTIAHLPWEERLKLVPKKHCRGEADWEFMCRLFESETFKKASVINSGNRSRKNPSYVYRGGSKSLSQYKYDAADDGSGEKDVVTVSNAANSSEKGCPGESVNIANNDEEIGLVNQDDGSQSPDEVDAAKREHDQAQESRARHVAGLGDGLQPPKSTCCDATSLIATIAELRKELVSTRDELHSTQAALRLTEDKTRMLEANQKRLEETIRANTQVVDANQRMMKQVFERLASDIAQSLSPPPHCP